MCSRCLSLFALAMTSAFAGDGVLRVCADPNNLPFSNDRRDGFENKIAELAAHSLGEQLEYTWQVQRRGLVRNTLNAGICDVLPGVPSSLDSVEATVPYYRSTYVFVSRRDRRLGIASLADPALQKLKIGIHMAGDDYAPPSVALGRRGLAANITGYSLFGAYGDRNPPARLVDAVARGDVDLAVVWGPLAGYFARRAAAPLVIVPVAPAAYMGVPFTFDISMGVRKGDAPLKSALDGVLRRECAAVQKILMEYGVPQVGHGEGKPGCGSFAESSPSAHSR